MCLSVRGSYSLFARPANIQSVSAIQGDLLGSSRVIIKLDNCNTESSKMPASFSYVVYLHPVASNWRLPKDPIAAAECAVQQHTDRLLRLLRRKNRQDDDGEQRGATSPDTRFLPSDSRIPHSGTRVVAFPLLPSEIESCWSHTKSSHESWTWYLIY